MSTVSKWIPTTDLLTLRRMGKLSEELGELSAVAARVIIQGMDEVDPSSGKTNRHRLQEEIADVLAQIEVTREAFGLDISDVRIARKIGDIRQWEAMFE